MDKEEDEDGQLQARKVLQLLRRLLAEHEVRLTVDLLEALSDSPLSQAKVVLSNRAFHQSLSSFAEKQRNSGLAAAVGLRLLEPGHVPARPQAKSTDSVLSTQATLSGPHRSVLGSDEVPAILLSRPGTPEKGSAVSEELRDLEELLPPVPVVAGRVGSKDTAQQVLDVPGLPVLPGAPDNDSDSSSGSLRTDPEAKAKLTNELRSEIRGLMPSAGGAATASAAVAAKLYQPQGTAGRRKSWFSGLASAAPALLTQSGSPVVVSDVAGGIGGRRNSFREARTRNSVETKLASYGGAVVAKGREAERKAEKKPEKEGAALPTSVVPTFEQPLEPSPSSMSMPELEGRTPKMPAGVPPPLGPSETASVTTPERPERASLATSAALPASRNRGSVEQRRSLGFRSRHSAGFLVGKQRKSDGATWLGNASDASRERGSLELSPRGSGAGRSLFQAFTKSTGSSLAVPGLSSGRKSDGGETDDGSADKPPPRKPELRRVDSKMSLGGDMDDFYHDDSEDDHFYGVRWGDDLDDLTSREQSWLALPTSRWISHPNSAKRACWDIIMLLFIVSECVTLPLRLCFLIEMPEWWTWGMTAFFAVDIFFNFNTGYFYKSVLIMRTPFIIRNYLRTWFILDFASTFPWEEAFQGFIVAGGQATFLRLAKLGKLMRCLRLLRLMKIGRLLSRFQDIALFNSYSVSFGLSLAKMLFIFGMLCHWAACIWGAIGDPTLMNDASKSEDPHEKGSCVPGGPCENGIWGSPWRHRYGMDNFDVPTQYLAALHFATGLVTGSELAFSPAFWAERVFTVVAMIVSLFICAAILSQVLVMINRLAERDIERKEQVIMMREFMINRKVCPELQAKVRRYLESQAETKRGQGNIEVLNLLSESLKAEVIVYLNRRTISKHPFFERFTEGAMRKICLLSVTYFYAAGENVVEKGQIATSCHFIVRGKLKVDKAKDNKCVYLEAGSWLGDKCLFIPTRRTHTVCSVTPAEVLCVVKDVVMAVCQEVPFLNSHYEAFRERICAGENLLLCPHCRKVGHNEKDCPEVQRRKTMEVKEAPNGKTSFINQVRSSFSQAGRGSFLVHGKTAVAEAAVRGTLTSPSSSSDEADSDSTSDQEPSSPPHQEYTINEVRCIGSDDSELTR